MNINVLHVLLLLLIHFLADFGLQTDWQAKNKAKNQDALARHVLNYSLCFILPIACVLPVTIINALLLGLLFSFITFWSHFGTDAYTSKLVGKLHADGDIHNMFVVIGMDQLLHAAQLILTYGLILNIIK
jgi:uncharacterized Tic20 family protein